jgi:multiple sugar transport system permease protein
MNANVRQITGGLIPLFFLIVLIGVAPFGDAFFTSFYHDTYGERSFAGLENYRFLLSDQGFGYSLTITILWAIANAVLSILLSFIFATALVNKTRKFYNFFYFILLIPWGIPVYIAVPLWRAFVHGNGGESLLSQISGISVNLMVNPVSSFLAVMLVSLWMAIPLTTFVILGALRKIPKTVTEAAAIEGANAGDLARNIYLPAVYHSLLVMGLLNFINALKEFTVVFLMTAGGPPLVSGITDHHIIGATTTLGILLYEMFTETDDFGITSTYSIVMAAIVFLVMAFWLLVRRKQKRSVNKLILFIALVQPVFNLPWGLVWTGLYLVTLRYKKLFYAVLLLQAGVFLFNLIHTGFLQALSPGFILALFTAVFLRENRSRNTIRSGFINRGWPLLTEVFIALMVASSFLILYMLLWMSFSGVSTCYVNSIIPDYFSPRSFIAIFTDEHILSFFLNTLIVAGATAILIPFITFPAAALLSLHTRQAGKTVLFIVQILGIAGGMHTLIPLYSMFLKLNLINSYIPLVMIYLYHAIPFSLFTMLAYLNSIPQSFRDHAAIEGATPLRYTFSILFPVSLPVITTAAMVAFLGGWNGFMAPLLFLNEDAKYTISIKLYALVGSIASGSPKWNLFAAASTVNMFIIGFLFVRFKKPLQLTALREYQE